MINRLKEILQHVLRRFGYKIVKISKTEESLLNELTMRGALRRCVKRGIDIKSVIDVGASNGSWSKLCLDYYPKANYLLIEAQKEHENDLLRFTTINTNTDYKIIAAGDVEGEIFFDNSDLYGGLASHQKINPLWITVPVTTVSALINEFHLEPPYFIKLDTHGFEIPILEGAKNILKDTNLLVIEAYNFIIAENSLRFFELCEYLKQYGFLPIDLVDLTLRKLDNSFWQMDIFFIKQNRDEFQNNIYK